MDATDKAKQLLGIPPIKWQAGADALSESERDEIRRALEGLAERAAMLARYMDERCGAGCGDQGHAKAVKAANRAGRAVWCKVFGYNAFLDLTI